MPTIANLGNLIFPHLLEQRIDGGERKSGIAYLDDERQLGCLVMRLTKQRRKRLGRSLHVTDVP